jgi:YVTN family beta-propeller protein
MFVVPRPRRLLTAATLTMLLLITGCGSDGPTDTHGGDDTAMANMPTMTATPTAWPSASTAPEGLLPGMPPPLDPHDLYAADRPNLLSDAVRNDLPRIYVPNNRGASVSVIDPATFTVIQTVKVAVSPEHVVPSWDLRTLWVNSDRGNTLTPIDPATGHFGRPVPVNDPYNLYFSPDGKWAIVMSEAAHQIVFRDAHTMAVHKTVPVSCDGVNHADFSPDGHYFIASCEFSGDLIKVDTEKEQVVGQMHLKATHPMPQDVKISPDGRTWYVADMHTSGIWILNGDAFTPPRFLDTGAGAHGLYVSRDSKNLYITNRGEGSISLLNFATGTLVAKWQIPGGGSPDMGGLSADGTVMWMSGRYDGVVYAIDTRDGHLIRKIKVGTEPHGLLIWPQPGRYSLGHTGIMR